MFNFKLYIKLYKMCVWEAWAFEHISQNYTTIHTYYTYTHILIYCENRRLSAKCNIHVEMPQHVLCAAEFDFW